MSFRSISSSPGSSGNSTSSPKIRSRVGHKLFPTMPLSVNTDRSHTWPRRRPFGSVEEPKIVVSSDDPVLSQSPPTPSYVLARRPSPMSTQTHPLSSRTRDAPLSPAQTGTSDLLLPRPTYARSKSPSGDSVSTISDAATTPRAANNERLESLDLRSPASARKRDSTQRRLSALRGLVANLDFSQHWSMSEPKLGEESFTWACGGNSGEVVLSTPNFASSSPALLNDVSVDRPRANKTTTTWTPDLVEILSPVSSPPSPYSLSPLPSIPEQMPEMPRSRSESRLQMSKRPRKFGASSDLLIRSRTPEPPRPSSRMRLEKFDVASSGYSKCLEPASPMVPNTPTATWRSTLSSELVYNTVIRTHGIDEVKRQEIVWEMCETEIKFVKSLGHVVRLFAAPLQTPAGGWIQGIPARITELFGYFQRILDVHNQLVELQRNLRENREVINVASFISCMQHWLPDLSCHEPYLVRFEGVVKLVEENVRDPSSFFGEFVRMQMKQEVLGSMTLGSMLHKPVQRLTKYPLFLRRLLEVSPYPHPCHEDLLGLLSRTESTILNLQATKAREEDFEQLQALERKLQGLPVGVKLAVRGRKLLAQGAVVRIPPHKDLSPSWARSRSTSIQSSSSLASISSTFSSACSSPWDSSSATSPSTARTSAFSISSSESSHCPPSRSSSLLQISPKKKGMTRSVSASSSLSDPLPFGSGSLRGLKRREEVLTMLIFNDLVVLASESDKSNLFSGKKRDKTYTVLPESEGGLCRVTEVKDWSGWQGHGAMFSVTSLPYTLGTLAPGPITLTFTLPSHSHSSSKPPPRGIVSCPVANTVPEFIHVLSQTLPLRQCSGFYSGVGEEMLRSVDQLAS